jgi:ADP-ribosylglycohydrolase
MGIYEAEFKPADKFVVEIKTDEENREEVSKEIEEFVANANANGGAMRVAPLAVTANTLDEALARAEEQCLVSHTTDIAINGTKAIAAAIFLAKEGVAVGKSVAEIKDIIKSYIEEKFGYDLNMSLKDIQARSTRLSFLKALYNIAGIASEEYENSNLSSASLSCPMAIMAFLYGENYEASIRYALAMGGDADTIACMAGCISAQVYGIPQQIVDEALLYLPPEMIDVLN